MDAPNPHSEASQADNHRQDRKPIVQNQKQTHPSDLGQKNNSPLKCKNINKDENGIGVQAEGDQTPSSPALQDKAPNENLLSQIWNTIVNSCKDQISTQDGASNEQHSRSTSKPASKSTPKPRKKIFKSDEEEGSLAPGGMESESGSFRATVTRESFGLSIGARGWKRDSD